MPVLRILAPAKLNLALAVGACDAEGMHPICSWMVTIDLCDELTITRLEPGRLSRYAILWHDEARRRSDIDWSISDDLAVRAHLALERHVGRALPVQLKLEKRIPVGGGLAGGSSAAAAMLRGVNALFNLDFDPQELNAIGARLGSDVPFLIRGGSAVVEGRGEQIAAHDDVPDLHVVLVFPAERCPTGEVYRRFDDHPPGPLQPDRVRALVAGTPTSEALFNDLAPAAIRVAPTVGALIASVSQIAERAAHVSGSGSSLFVLCDDAMHAQFLAEAIEQRTGHPTIAARTAGSVELDPMPNS